MNCSATLTAIAGQCGKYLGGISKFYVINRDKIGAITVSNGAITNITLSAAEPTTGDGFIEYAFRKNTANVVTTGNADDSGRNMSFTTVATLEFGKQETAKRVGLQALIETDAYAIYEDRNHNRWMMGYDDAISANVNAETGSTPTDINKYILTVQSSDLALPLQITMSDEDFAELLDENL